MLVSEAHSFQGHVCFPVQGSGKTAAFVLPMLTYIMSQPKMTEKVAENGPYAVIMAPTRELAQQVRRAFPSADFIDSMSGSLPHLPYGRLSYHCRWRRDQHCMLSCSNIIPVEVLLAHEPLQQYTCPTFLLTFPPSTQC